MKSRTSTCITAMILFAALSAPLRLAAQVTGSGTINYVPIWTGGTTLGNSTIFQTGSKVGIHTTAPTATLTVIGPNALATQNASTALQASGGAGGNGITNVAPHGGTGGGIVLMSGPGGTSACGLVFCALGGSGGSVTISGGKGGNGPNYGGPGGYLLLQPGAGGSGSVGKGSPGNVLLAPYGGNVGVGTTSPAAKLYVAGSFIATGTKSALVETASYGKRQLYAVESPENWFEDFGGERRLQGPLHRHSSTHFF